MKHIYSYWVRQGKSGLYNICPNCTAFWQYPKWAIVNNTLAIEEGNQDTTYLCQKCYHWHSINKISNYNYCDRNN